MNDGMAPLLDYELADVFTDIPHQGNQLAVVHGGTHLADWQMQRLGQEFNLSETVVVHDVEEERGLLRARVRLFTATTEVPFAGHPLLGTAALLAQRHGQAREVRLEAPGGPVPVHVDHQGRGRYTAWMQQPLPAVRTYEWGAELAKVLGLPPSALPVLTYDAGIPHVYLAAPSVEHVAALRPDFSALRSVVGPHRINVFATDAPGRATTRMFSAFDAALPEDPACGSAAGPLAAHLVRHGLLDSGAELTLSQGAQVGRPSTLYVRARCSGDRIESIHVGGGVCWIGAGHILCPAQHAQPDSGSGI